MLHYVLWVLFASSLILFVEEYPNIRAFAVCPGIVDTDALLDAFRPMAKDTRE